MSNKENSSFDRSKAKLQTAVSSFDHMIGRLIVGELSWKEFKLLKENAFAVKALCAISQEGHTADSVQQVLDEQDRDWQEVTQIRKSVRTFCSSLNKQLGM